MHRWRPLAEDTVIQTRDMTVLALLALLAGMAAGVICAAFRFAIERGDVLRAMVVARAHEHPVLGPLMMIAGAAILSALAASLVRRFAPMASGSGIPHAEAVLEGELPPAPSRLVPIKFLGGLLAMSGGLALGREGPSVQMGASVANLIGRVFRREWTDRRALIAGGAGSGLATAFNAPGAGAVFVLEELVGRFDPRIGLVALGASVGAITVSRGMLGNDTVFAVAEMSAGGISAQALFLALGLFVGLLAILYNRSLLATLSLAERIGGPVELRAAMIGGVVGLLAWGAPHLVGGGDNIAQSALSGEMLLTILPALFLFRLFLGAVSYAAATPGGLFSPMLALGAMAGLGFGHLAVAVFPEAGVQPEAFALVGMGAFFAGVVRAPLTGIVLVTEMTGTSSLLLPLLGGCFGAMLVTETLKDKPIYVALRGRAAVEKR